MNILDAGLHACQLTSIEQIYGALDLITVNGAKTLHIQDAYGIAPGQGRQLYRAQRRRRV